MKIHFRTEAILFESVGFTSLELQYLDARLIKWIDEGKDDRRNISDQAFLAVALTMASACVNALIQLQGRPEDVHGFGAAKYSGLLSSRQRARANYYYLLWENLNNDPTDIGSADWWEWQKEQFAKILIAVEIEFPDDTPELSPVEDKETLRETLTADEVATITAATAAAAAAGVSKVKRVIQPGTP